MQRWKEKLTAPSSPASSDRHPFVSKLQGRLLLDTLLLGIIGAFSARLFDYSLSLVKNLSLKRLAGYVEPGLGSQGHVIHQVIGSHGWWLIPAVVAVGGLISGILVYSIAPEAEGHGTDTAVKSFHRRGGFIRSRVTPLKMVASAITIGTGGAAGREGPTALFSAGIGSIYATIKHSSDYERRLLVLIGMAAGLSAIFRSPIGTAIFAVEVLYGEMEFETDALPYTMLGSVIAYAVNGFMIGWEPLFRVPAQLGVNQASDYAWYTILGVCSGVLGILIPNIFYTVRDLFHKIPIPPHVKPAIGGLFVGIMALWLPQVLGGGYGWIQEAINGRLALSLMFLLIFAKVIAFSLTVSSGGSGGVFAPTLFIGAMLGGSLAYASHQPPAAFAVVGMAAVFGSAARVPLATLLMVTEMTGGYSLLVPAALAVTIGSLIQTTFSSPFKYKSLYEGQMKNRFSSPAHRIEYLRKLMKMIKDQLSFNPNAIGHIDLLTLLEKGIPVDLPDGNQLIFGTLLPESPCIGQPVGSGCLSDNAEEYRIIGIFREGNLILPHASTTFEANDEVLLISTSKVAEQIKNHLGPALPSQ